MPVYWFALSQVLHPDIPRAILIFFIIHFLLYPSSNGYNSYVDRDEESIGGLKSPPTPTRQLFYVSIIMDLLAVLLSLWISIYFMMGTLLYILASRAYSSRQIRLKKYPVWGYLTVVVFQGAMIFFMVYHGAGREMSLKPPLGGVITASLLIGGFYPLTQIYQHAADTKDGVRTLSSALGYRGTFIFCGIVYSIAFAALALYFQLSLEIKEFLIFATCMVPVIVYFMTWAVKVWRDPSEANYVHTMRMNRIASCCTNLGFIVVFLMHYNMSG